MECRPGAPMVVLVCRPEAPLLGNDSVRIFPHNFQNFPIFTPKMFRSFIPSFLSSAHGYHGPSYEEQRRKSVIKLLSDPYVVPFTYDCLDLWNSLSSDQEMRAFQIAEKQVEFQIQFKSVALASASAFALLSAPGQNTLRRVFPRTSSPVAGIAFVTMSISGYILSKYPTENKYQIVQRQKRSLLESQSPLLKVGVVASSVNKFRKLVEDAKAELEQDRSHRDIAD